MKKIFILSFILFTQSALAEIVSNFSNMCGTYHYMYAVPKSFTCESGQFLPANSHECISCPSGYTCTGDTYPFNSKKAQGLIRNGSYISLTENNTCSVNMGHILNGIFTKKQIHCAPGYYLIANDITCTICPQNHYCPGGTYTFNETINQGINECSNSFAPAGMWLASQCGRKLHVGDDVLYLHLQQSHPTSHQLHISYNNVTYSANAVPRDTNSNTFPKMSDGATHGLHVMINGVEYLVCDDSVPECRGGE